MAKKPQFRGGYGGPNMNQQASLMRQAQKMQEELVKAQTELENSQFTGFSTLIRKRMTGVTAMAMVSGASLARLLGEISPKISTRTVITAVETLTPALPIQLTNSMVPTDAKAMLTMLLPTRMVDSSSSYRSDRASVASARFFLGPLMLFSRARFREEKAVSVAEKKADKASRIKISRICMGV